MKKLLVLVLILVMLTAVFAGCAKETYEIAMVTDKGDIDDKSFNQTTWEAVEAYGLDNDKTFKYYKPIEATDAEYLATVELAIKAGAKVVVTPGWMFGPAIFAAQDEYPDIHFIIIDTAPHSADYSEFRTEDNVYSVVYKEEQVGFFAGYAAVKEGYTKLGYLGGQAVPAVIKYGWGFIVGAEYAAKEMGLDSVEIKYHYTGDFTATPKNQTTAATMFADGTEVIFAAGGSVGESAMAAAEAAGGKVIGVDVDQSGMSDTVITSAMKFLVLAVEVGLDGHYAGNFPGGENAVYDITNDGVGMEIENARFNVFTAADYAAIVAEMQDESTGIAASIPVPPADSTGEPDAVETTIVTIEVVK